MSKVKIQGNASGSGTLTIAAPNTNTDRTLTLPDGSGEVVTTDGSGNVAIGDGKWFGFGDVNERIAGNNAGYMQFFTNGTERMRIDSSGNLLVGTTSSGTVTKGFAINNAAPYTYIDIGHPSGTGGGSSYSRFKYNNTVIGSIQQSGTTGVSYNTSSDYRLKTDVQPMTGATERLKALKPVNFEWISSGERVDGFLAHEAQEVVPEAVTGTKDAMRTEEYEVTPAVLDDDGNVVTEAVMGEREVPDYQGIDQSKLVPLLVATIQELEARIAALEAV